jgi:hypothetical protein
VSLFIANPIHVACDSRPCRYPKRKAGNPKVLGGWFSSLYRTTAIMPNKKSSFVPLAHPRPSAPRGLDILCAELLKEADRRSAQPPREPAGRFSVGLAERRYPDGAAKLILWIVPNWSAHRPVTLAAPSGPNWCICAQRSPTREQATVTWTPQRWMSPTQGPVTEHCRESRLDGAPRFAEERSSPDQIGALFGATKNGAESCLTMTPAKTISRAVTAFKGLTDKGLTKGSGRG